MRYLSSLTHTLIMLLIMLIPSILVGNTGPESRFKSAYKQSEKRSDLKIPILNKWNGFEIIEFKFDGVDAKIVFPNQ